MKCIYCFFEQKKQREIIRLSHMLEQTFEESLDRYLKFYKEFFKESLENEICLEHHSEENQKIKNLQKYLLKSQDSLLKDIENDVLTLKEIYLNYVNGKTELALSNFENIYKKILSENVLYLEDQIFFRGRRGSVQLTKKDLFHIPFNKRYLISNQRYSLSGRPILYLGYNADVVLREITEDISKDKIKEIYLSAFSLKEQVKAFDFTSDSFYNYMESYLYASDTIGVEVSNKKIRKLIRQMNIINCCSFPRRHRGFDQFCEEYVLPQLLAIIINKQEFQAIIYKSTKDFNIEETNFFSKREESDSRLHREYKNNIAFFTKIKKEENDIYKEYDEELYNKFEIISPIKVEKLLENVKVVKKNCIDTDAVSKAREKSFDYVGDNKHINIIENNLFFIVNCKN